MNVSWAECATADAAGALLPLAPADLHLWMTSYDGISDARLLAAYRELLNDAERAQEPRFYFERDRLRYLVTRALVRTVLSRYAAIDPREWVFSENAYGRPEIANTDAGVAGLAFNLSHTHSLIVLGVTRGRALGVDVENIAARRISMDIAGRYFSPAEVAVLLAAPRHEQQYRFFEYWTFKEAYIKARGMGLSLPLDKFSFQYAGDREVAISIDPELGDDASRWQFWQFRPSPEYLVAICADRSGAGDPHVSVRHVTPMQHEEPIVQEFLRVTARAAAAPITHYGRI